MALSVETAGLQSTTLQAAVPHTTHQMVVDVGVTGGGDKHQPVGVIHAQLLHLDITTFGWVTRPDSKTKIGKGRPFTPPYVYKLALQFQMTDSRSQRFNFKRRLRDLAEKQPDLKELIEDVLATYMTA